MNVSADSKIYTDTNVISCSDKTYYSLDVVVIFIFDYDYKIAFKLYESALNNGLIFNEYINHKIDEEKKTFNELRSIVKEQEDVIDSFINTMMLEMKITLMVTIALSLQKVCNF